MDLRNDVLRHNLRSLMGNVLQERNWEGANFFDDLKTNVQDICATHYSPNKVKMGKIPELGLDNDRVGLQERYAEKRTGTGSPRRTTKQAEKITEVETKDTIGKGYIKSPTARLVNDRSAKFASTETDRSKGSPKAPRVQRDALRAQRSRIPVRVGTETAKSMPSPSRTNLLLNKVESQSERIAQLEAEVRGLRLTNQKLQESNRNSHNALLLQKEQMERDHDLMQMLERQKYEAIAARDNRNQYNNASDYDEGMQLHDNYGDNKGTQFHNDYEEEFANTIDPNHKLGRDGDYEHGTRNEVIHAPHLNQGCEQSYNASKLNAALEINRFYTFIISKLAHPSDSTTNLLLGYSDSTTQLLLGGRNVYDQLFPRRLTPRSTLRAVFLAVLFTVRLKYREHR